MTRVPPSSSQKDRLLEANAYHCCVCKRANVGFHFHHIDEDNSNTVESNLAVLCVEDHDRHHRDTKYEVKPNHTELDSAEITRLKKSWESFVAEAQGPAPTVVATISTYGNKDLVHSLQLVMQWPDERIEYAKSYHLLDGDLEKLKHEMIKEIRSVGKEIKLALISDTLPVDHCPCCGKGFSRTIKPVIVTRLTDPGWDTDSHCDIYVNPGAPHLTASIYLRGNLLIQSSLHLCQDRFLHFHNEWLDDRIPIKPRPSVRMQASQIIADFLCEWNQTKINIATGDLNNLDHIKDLLLPRCWEVRRQGGHTIMPKSSKKTSRK